MSSFVKRLSADLERGFQQRARGDFNLASRARVTFPKLWSHDLHVVSSSTPDIVIG